MCSHDLREQMNATSAHVPASVDEMIEAGLEPAPCNLVKPPRVKASPIALECKYMQTVRLPNQKDGSSNNTVFGQIVGVHVSDDVIHDGIIDPRLFKPLARLGYLDYVEFGEVFTMTRPA